MALAGERTVAFRESGVDRRMQPRVRRLEHRKHPPRMLALRRRDETRGCVRASVVHEHEFRRQADAVELAENADDERRQVALLIVHGHDDGKIDHLRSPVRIAKTRGHHRSSAKPSAVQNAALIEKMRNVPTTAIHGRS